MKLRRKTTIANKNIYAKFVTDKNFLVIIDNINKAS